MPRAVLDPNVLISALITPDGACAPILEHLAAGAFELVISPSLLNELADVLRRDAFRKYVALAEVEAYVELLRRESVMLPDPELPAAPHSADAGDDYLIALATAADAHALVSGDRHLLDLAPALPVLSPGEFLAQLERL